MFRFYAVCLVVMLAAATSRRANSQEIPAKTPEFEYSFTKSSQGPDHSSYVLTCPRFPDATVTATCILQDSRRQVLGRFPLQRNDVEFDRNNKGYEFVVSCVLTESITPNYRLELYIRPDDSAQKTEVYNLPLRTATSRKKSLDGKSASASRSVSVSGSSDGN